MWLVVPSAGASSKPSASASAPPATPKPQFESNGERALEVVLGSTSGLPDGLFSNQNRNLGKFWRALEYKMLVYIMTIWNILWPYGIICGRLL
jgi:hypothetical protein